MMNERETLSDNVIFRRPLSLSNESFRSVEEEIRSQYWDAVFIDSGTDLIKKSPSESEAEQKLGHVLEDLASDSNQATVLIIQEDSRRDEFQPLEFMADNVVELTAERSTSGHFDRYLRVEKSCKPSTLGEYMLLLDTPDNKPCLVNLESESVKRPEEEKEQTNFLKPKQVATGVGGLDEMLGTKLDNGTLVGFGRGSNVLVTGTAGSRKTLLALFFLAAEPDEPGLLVSTKEPKVKLFRAQVPNLNRRLQSLDEVFYSGGHASLGKLYVSIKTEIDNGKNYKRVVINTISDFAQMSAGSHHFEDVLFKILQLLNRAGATVMLIVDTAAESKPEVLNMVKIRSFVDSHLEVSKAIVAYIEHITFRIVKHWGVDYDKQIKELMLEGGELKIEPSFQMFVGLRNGEPRLVEINLKLIAENSAERRFNDQLTKECEFLVGSTHQVNAGNYSSSEIIDIFEACMTSLPFLRSNATITMVDEPWVKLVIEKRSEELANLKCGSDPAATKQLLEEYFDYLVSNCSYGNEDGNIYALPLYSDIGLFCANRFHKDNNSSVTSWKDVINKAKEAIKNKKADYGFLFNVFLPDTVASFMLELIWGFDASCLWDGKFDADTCAKALAFLQDMVFKEEVTPRYSKLCTLCRSKNPSVQVDTEQSGLCDLMRKSAFFRTWYSQLVSLEEASQREGENEPELSITTLPTAKPKGEAHSVLGPWYIVGFSGPAPLAVATLVKELCSAEKERRRFLTGAGLPVRKEVSRQLTHHRVKYTDLRFDQLKTDLLDNGRCRSEFGNFAALRNVLYDSAIVMMDDEKAKPKEFAEMIGSVFVSMQERGSARTR